RPRQPAHVTDLCPQLSHARRSIARRVRCAAARSRETVVSLGLVPLPRRVSWRLLLGIALAVLSVVFLWHFPWRKSLSAIAGAQWGAIGLALVAKALAVFARAERVHAMLHRVLRVGRGMLVRYVFCGFAADNLLASTAGVAARTWLVVRHGGAPL